MADLAVYVLLSLYLTNFVVGFVMLLTEGND